MKQTKLGLEIVIFLFQDIIHRTQNEETFVLEQHLRQFIQNVFITSINRHILLHSRRLRFCLEHDFMEIPHIVERGLCVPRIAASLDLPLHFVARIFAWTHSQQRRLLDRDGDRRAFYIAHTEQHYEWVLGEELSCRRGNLRSKAKKMGTLDANADLIGELHEFLATKILAGEFDESLDEIEERVVVEYASDGAIANFHGVGDDFAR